ncbi:DUF3943 domain-containing protein [Vitiosangium sp. GDMCC 1.1324]|uniref:DUF3943 domain-containing protein n=1 Tax=Vitiosangium sp. (strain GDMCC 1.1324) TaxID=2138576 RepID=UPI000D37A72B|nr:DUF3943 domain-containing protein [Vitiosangium sp. GDMCC 1.1324]PTL80262.1 DUF3943 domain-containing protein [Vitiosangium sp. GDMCC 1.1324]
MHIAGVLVALHLVTAGLPALVDEHAEAPAAKVAEQQEVAPPHEHPWLALAEVTALNGLVWAYDRFVQKQDWARVGPSTWAAGVRNGLVWDEDDFATNQFLHPYHGAFYATAARDNGFGYWESGLFALIGAFQWEYLAERDAPSANDIINTTLGGNAMGEVLYRLSSLALDNGATGGERVRRELVAGLLSPLRGVNRLLRGDAWRLGPTPTEWRPSRFVHSVSGGWRRLTYVDSPNSVQNGVAIDVDLFYGDLFREPVRHPFDAFDARLQLASGTSVTVVSRAEILGALAAHAFLRTEQESFLLGVGQAYRYANNRAYELGAQSFDGGLFYRRQLWAGTEVRASLLLRGVLLAAISSEYAARTGRNYDYGPGLGIQLEAMFSRGDWNILTFEAGSSWIHPVSGSNGNHFVRFGRLKLDVPVYGHWGLGGAFDLFVRESHYESLGDVFRRSPQFQVFVSFH